MARIEKINESGRHWLSFALHEFISQLKVSVESEKEGILVCLVKNATKKIEHRTFDGERG